MYATFTFRAPILRKMPTKTKWQDCFGEGFPLSDVQLGCITKRIVYNLKYHQRPEIGIIVGKMMAQEFHQEYFFDDIDLLIPLPLSHERERERGYNQSMMIAQGIAEITGLPIMNDVVIRKSFISSQTQKDRWTRTENVEGVFELVNGDKIQGKHILLIDDVVTTGATLCSCGEELAKAGNIQISIASIGFAKP